MTPERAKQLLYEISFPITGALRYSCIDPHDIEFHSQGITADEHETILTRWRTMNGKASYRDALVTFTKETPQ